MKQIDVCLSPELLEKYNLTGKIVVVVDILRATSCITTALAYGIASIKPVATVEECQALQLSGLIASAERDGKKVEGFELDNSPFSYMDPALKNKNLAITTTNGTLAISKSLNASEIIIGCFLNISAVANYLICKPNDVLILCAGWKGKVNLEDSLFAGALAHMVKSEFLFADDAPLMVETLYLTNKNDLMEVISKSSHVQRLKRLNIHNDIEFCLRNDLYDVIPVLKDNKLVKMS